MLGWFVTIKYCSREFYCQRFGLFMKRPKLTLLLYVTMTTITLTRILTQKIEYRPLLFSYGMSNSLLSSSPIISLFKKRARWNVQAVGVEPEMSGTVTCVAF